jgi:hypothetical protein
MPLSETTSYAPDRILAGDAADLITDAGTLITGQNLKRGTAMGKITASGKLTQLDSTKADGSQNIHSILAADCDATGADKVCSIYIGGEFNANAVVFKGADTAADFKDAGRLLGIYFRNSVKA